jgi:hypothetical protein
LYQRVIAGVPSDTPVLKTTTRKSPTDWSRDGQYIIYTNEDSKAKADCSRDARCESSAPDRGAQLDRVATRRHVRQVVQLRGRLPAACHRSAGRQSSDEPIVDSERGHGGPQKRPGGECHRTELSPHGHRIAYAAFKGGRRSIWTIRARWNARPDCVGPQRRFGLSESRPLHRPCPLND